MRNKEQSEFSRHISGRMNLFLFMLLLILSIAFAGIMGETVVMVINSLYERSEYPVRMMEAFYPADALDKCVQKNKKTPDITSH